MRPVLDNEDASRARHFRFWAICLLLIVIWLAYRLLARQHSEQFVSVNFFISSHGVFGPGSEAIGIEVSNRMSFDVHFWTEIKVLYSGKWTTIMGSIPYPIHTLSAHAQNTAFLLKKSDGMRVNVCYGRKLELSSFQFSENTLGSGSTILSNVIVSPLFTNGVNLRQDNDALQQSCEDPAFSDLEHLSSDCCSDGFHRVCCSCDKSAF
jgi:hypothetical protein